MTKRTSEIAQRSIESGISPLEYMLRVMRDSKKPAAMRMDAAKAAAPFIHPKLSSIELDLAGLSDEELRAAAAAPSR